MTEFTKTQYIRYLMAKRKSSRKRAIYILIAVLLPLAIAGFILLPLVKINILNIPPEAQEYLLKTIFYNFSADELKQILLRTTGTSSSLSILLSIYWGYYLCGVIAILGNISMTFMKTKYKSYERGIIAIQRIRDAVQDTPKTLSSEQRFQVRRAIRFGQFYAGIVPLPKEWLKKTEYQWFAQTLNSQKLKTIIFTLSKIETIFLGVISNFPRDLSLFIDSLNNLERFYLLLANRSDDEKFKIIDLDKNTESEYDILYSFTNQIRPYIFATKSQDNSARKEGLRQIIGNLIQSVWQDETVKQAGSISGIAASIMLIGVLIFKIEITQAFLTWFTITFGSLSISVGISKRNKNKSKQEDESD